MTPLQTLELRMGDLRRHLAELIGAAEPDTGKIETLIGEIRATDALLVAQKLMEPEPKPETVIKGTAEVRELRQLLGSASLGRMMTGIADDAEGVGADRELRQHLHLPANYIPWHLLAENRAALAMSGDEEGNTQPWITSVFPMSAAAFCGLDVRTVAVGEELIPLISTGLTIGFPGAGTAQTEGAPVAATKTLTPRRATGNFPVNKEDMLKYPGLEEGWRVEMAAAIQNALDIDLLRKTNAGVLTHGTAPTAPADSTTAAEFLADIYGSVDGSMASAVDQLGLLVGPETFGYMGGLPYDAGSGLTVADKIRGIGVRMFVTDNAGAYASNHQAGCVIVGPPQRNASAAVWNGIEVIADGFSLATSGQVRFTVAAFWDFALNRPTAYIRKSYRR